MSDLNILNFNIRLLLVLLLVKISFVVFFAIIELLNKIFRFIQYDIT